MESQPERALIPSTATIARVTPIPSRKGASAREGIDTILSVSSLYFPPSVEMEPQPERALIRIFQSNCNDCFKQ